HDTHEPLPCRFHANLDLFGCVTFERDDAEDPCHIVDVCRSWRCEQWEDCGDFGFPIGFHAHRCGTGCGCPLRSLDRAGTGTSGGLPLCTSLLLDVAVWHRECSSLAGTSYVNVRCRARSVEQNAHECRSEALRTWRM